MRPRPGHPTRGPRRAGTSPRPPSCACSATTTPASPSWRQELTMRAAAVVPRRYPSRKKKTGRPSAIGPAELATLRRLVDDGVSVTEAARTLKIGRSTAYAALAQR
ncbi:helix-turn-helix domain-containing protein [Microbispora maris]|uniref:helix-turn-helix domain-containing protein n=1 Tax=Microbispora maris TaxID=3144104 RepID=UPI003D15793C